VFLSAKKAAMVPFGENVYIKISFILEQILSSVAISPMLMSQQNILNKLSLNRYIHKTRLHIDQLTNVKRPKVHRTLSCISPTSNGSVFANSVFTMTLQNKITSNKNQQYLRFDQMLERVYRFHCFIHWSMTVPHFI
jgi:hypothetical protein